jgi:signal transduction histidine kinase
MIIKKITILCVLWLFQFAATAQLQRLKHIVFKETLGMPNRVINCMAEDANGVIWSASENVLQWFDGNRFHIVPYGNGPHEIPGLLFNQIYSSPENEIWIFYNKGFSVYQPSTNSFKHYMDIIPAMEGEIFLAVAEIKNELLLSSQKSLYYINRVSKKIMRFQTGQGDYYNPLPGYITRNYLYSIKDGSIVLTTMGNNKTHTLQRPDTDIPFNFYYYNNKGLYATDHYISFYDVGSGQLIKKITYPGDKYLQVYRKPSNIIQKDSKTLLALLDDELWEIDMITMSFSKRLVNLVGKNFISTGYYKNALYDKQGNLWVTSNLHGLIKIAGKTQPVQLIGPDDGEGNFVKCFRVNKASNIILTGTYGKGLMIYDTLGNLLKHFPLSPQGEGAIITTIGQLDANNYLALSHADPTSYLINCSNLSLKPLVANDPGFRPGYYSELVETGNNSFFYMAGGGPKKITISNDRLIYGDFPKEELKKVVATGTLKARTSDLTLFTGDPYFMKCLDQTGLKQIGTQVIVKRKNNWLFGTIKGIYEFDSSATLVNTYNVKSGLADEYIYAIVIDNEGNTWCSHNRGLSRIDAEGNIFNIGMEEGLQADEFNYGAAGKTSDGQLFFGGIKGLNAFYPAQLTRIDDIPKLFITHISSNRNILPSDTAFWNISSLKLPFANNQIKIIFSAIGNNPGNYYNYQYKVTGISNEWKNLGHTSEINLALPSGNYILEIAVGHSFNKNIHAQKKIYIEIVPPYYQSWWFIAITIMVLLAIVAFILQIINKNKYRKRLEYIKMQQELETERQRISRDLHDNMGAYTTALLANVEKLRIQRGQNDELVKMKNNADNILNSLRETIWVLNNKEISVADFSDGFKNYCMKALQNFEHISFEAGEIIDNNKIMTAAEAIHVDKILKEAFQNIIKHSNATQIHFTVISNISLQFSLTDNGKGYDIDTKTKGNGLENMRWRAREVGAELTIESSIGRGSNITIKK